MTQRRHRSASHSMIFCFHVVSLAGSGHGTKLGFGVPAVSPNCSFFCRVTVMDFEAGRTPDLACWVGLVGLDCVRSTQLFLFAKMQLNPLQGAGHLVGSGRVWSGWVGLSRLNSLHDWCTDVCLSVRSATTTYLAVHSRRVTSQRR